MGKTLIIANWKMNLTIHEASLLLHRVDQETTNHRDVEFIIAPSFLALPALSLQVNHRKFKLAAQNFYWRDEGAYTGEVSAHQLHGLVKYALVGHSERRHVFGESLKETGLKVQAALRNDIQPVLCIGETAFERSDGETAAVLHDQLIAGLHNITSDDLSRVVIAYEPVWAISNGKDFGSHATPTADDCREVAQVIRRQLTHLFGKAAAQNVPILYGGSVTRDNATTYLAANGIDGLLVGGASLDPRQFADIAKAAHDVTTHANKGVK